MNARYEKVDNTVVSPYQNFGAPQRIPFPFSSAVVANQYHARFATNYSTPVNVQTQGYWSNDNPGPCPLP